MANKEVDKAATIIEKITKLASQLDKSGQQDIANKLDKLATRALQLKFAQYVSGVGYWIRNERCWCNCYRQKRAKQPKLTAQEVWAACQNEYVDSINNPKSNWKKYADVDVSFEKFSLSDKKRANRLLWEAEQTFLREVYDKVEKGASLPVSVFETIRENKLKLAAQWDKLTDRLKKVAEGTEDDIKHRLLTYAEQMEKVAAPLPFARGPVRRFFGEMSRSRSINKLRELEKNNQKGSLEWNTERLKMMRGLATGITKEISKVQPKIEQLFAQYKSVKNTQDTSLIDPIVNEYNKIFSDIQSRAKQYIVDFQEFGNQDMGGREMANALYALSNAPMGQRTKLLKALNQAALVYMSSTTRAPTDTRTQTQTATDTKEQTPKMVVNLDEPGEFEAAERLTDKQQVDQFDSDWRDAQRRGPNVIVDFIRDFFPESGIKDIYNIVTGVSQTAEDISKMQKVATPVLTNQGVINQKVQEVARYLMTNPKALNLFKTKIQPQIAVEETQETTQVDPKAVIEFLLKVKEQDKVRAKGMYTRIINFINKLYGNVRNIPVTDEVQSQPLVASTVAFNLKGIKKRN